MAKAKIWIKAMRLRTLPLSISGIIVGSFYAYLQGFWDSSIFALGISTTLLFQILSNFANDLGDGTKGTDNHNRIGPERAIQSGEISVKQMKIAVALTVLLSFISAGFLIYFGMINLPKSAIWIYSLLAIASVLAAIFYTVGKKAYGYNGFGDVFVFIFFGLVSVLGIYPFYTKTIDLQLLFFACTIGLLSVAVLNLNNMRDRRNDELAGKKTLVVLMGSNLSKIYHSFLILGALICQILFISKIKVNEFNFLNINTLYISLIPYIILLLHLRKVMKTQQEKEFDPELKKVALSTFGISLLWMLATILS